MGLPVIPDRTQEQALTDLLESIALEETALAAFMNAEAEKVQAIALLLETEAITPTEAIEFQKTVAKLMKLPIKKEILLQFKLEEVLDFKKQLEIPTP